MDPRRLTLQDLFHSEAWAAVLKWAQVRSDSCKDMLSRATPTDPVFIAGLQAEIRLLRMMCDEGFEQAVMKEADNG